MTELKLDEIPEMVKSKKLSISSACITVHKIIYTNYARFGLDCFDEDMRSDFLLMFLETRIRKLIECYDPKVAPFGAFVYRAVQNDILSFKKRHQLNYSFATTVIRNLMLEFPEKMKKNQDSVTDIAEEVPPYVPENKSEEIPQLVFKRVFKKIPHRLTVKASQDRTLRQGILILALKSAWYINDEQIKKVSAFCRVSEDVITSSVCTLKSKLINKALNKRDIEQRRNRAYCFMNNYKKLLAEEKLYGRTSRFEELTRRLEYQKDSWKNKTDALYRGKYKVCPTNSDIAKVTGISPAVVSRYVNKLNTFDYSEIAEALGKLG